MAQKVAIVTGGSDGVGRALVLRLGQQGYDVATIGRTPDKIQSLKQEFKKLAKTDLLAETGDLLTESVLNGFIDSVRTKFSHIDVLINNAGFQIANELLENADIAAVGQMFKIHTLVPLQLYKAFYPAMKSQGHGTIINIVSVLARNYIKETYGPYAITKYSQDGLGKMMLKEASKNNIKITNVILGGANTHLRREPRPEYLTPSDIAIVISSLLAVPEKVFVPEIHLSPQVQLV